MHNLPSHDFLSVQNNHGEDSVYLVRGVLWIFMHFLIDFNNKNESANQIKEIECWVILFLLCRKENYKMCYGIWFFFLT